MGLEDIWPLKNWIALENDIHNKFGVNAVVFDAAGLRIANFTNWANRLCPVIKAHEAGQGFICSIAHRNVVATAVQTGNPVIDECDAGLIKLVIPIFINAEFLGVVSGCGLQFIGSKVETYLISKIVGLEREEIKNLSKDIKKIAGKKAMSLIEYIQNKVELIVTEFENNIGSTQKDIHQNLSVMAPT